MTASHHVLRRAITVAMFAACASCSRDHTTSAPQAPFPAPSASDATGLVDYAIVYDESHGELAVTETLSAGVGKSLDVEQGAAPFVVDAVVQSGAGSRALTRGADGFAVPECARESCVVRYRFELRAACTRLDDVDNGIAEGATLEAPPPTWLLAPWGSAETTRVRFRMTVPTTSAFLSGVFPAKDDTDETQYETTMGSLDSAPYTAFGPLRLRSVNAPGGFLRVGISPGELAVKDEDVFRWVESAAHAVSSYYGGMPLKREAVILLPSSGDAIGFGKSLAGGGATIVVRVGSDAKQNDFAEDWVLTHEMIHAAFPAQPRSVDWVEEGLATYVEPIARARVGGVSADEVWRGFIRGFPNGLPKRGDRGIDRTHTWGRTYWGGALFFFLADLELRKQTQGKMSLRDALVAILRKGGDNTSRMPFAEAFTIGDHATGTNVLTKLHEAWAEAPVNVDLAQVFTRLGVSLGSDDHTVKYDDSAPEAAIRKSFTARVDDASTPTK